MRKVAYLELIAKVKDLASVGHHELHFFPSYQFSLFGSAITLIE